jgi:RNA polymerase sigma-70 factor (ECF subfamily)
MTEPRSDRDLPASPVESTAALLAGVRRGDATARERLFARCLPPLRRWAHGRLPARARGMTDTDDLVQVTLVRALNRVEAFEPRHEGAFIAYLRQILLNAVREQIRNAARRPSGEPPATDLPDRTRSVVEEVVGRETLERYEAALAGLTEDQREAVILRLEFGYDWPAVSDAIGAPSPNAARMLVSRALLRLAETMDERRPGT